MIKYDSSYVKFEPIDPDTPEGAAEIQEFLKRALEFRMHPPAKRGRMAIPCDKDGIFGKPIFLENVLVVGDFQDGYVDPHVFSFCKEFCEKYLRTDEGSNTIKIVSHVDFPNKDGYRAVLWIRGNEELPFKLRNEFYGSCNGKPVFILGKAMIEACRGLDLASPQVQARMEMVYKASLGQD